jgi:hypothetical protein
MKNTHRILTAEPKWKRPFGKLGTDRSIILKRNIK